MRSIFLGIVIALSFTSCFLEQNERQQYVDPELEEYFTLFENQMIEAGLEKNLNYDYTIVFDELKELRVGWVDRDKGRIVINEQYRYDPAMVEYILVHECAHYFLIMEHHQGSVLMSDVLDQANVQRYIKNRNNSFEELFELYHRSK